MLRFRFIESASTNMALIPTILGFMQHAASPPAHLHRNMIIRLHTLIYGLIRLYQSPRVDVGTSRSRDEMSEGGKDFILPKGKTCRFT